MNHKTHDPIPAPTAADHQIVERDDGMFEIGAVNVSARSIAAVEARVRRGDNHANN
jgi:hypothetical protein